MSRFTVANALQSLDAVQEPFNALFSHGSLSLEVYKPEGVDLQKPHSRDEIYVIASGFGYFINGESREKCEQGEMLFVPAGTEHKFENFTEDFATWVMFYGPEGGEKNA